MATETKNLNKLTKNLGKYLDQDQLEQVKKAYFFAANAHSGQFRVSGDPYVSHPLAVAEILGKLKMDQDCLSAAMLHDVIEDSGCLLYTSPSPRDATLSRMPSSA